MFFPLIKDDSMMADLRLGFCIVQVQSENSPGSIREAKTSGKYIYVRGFVTEI